jgi:hypothetical protein
MEPEGFGNVKESWGDFLLVDLDLAMTFMDIAKASRIEETTRRNHDNARKAYNTALRLLEKLKLDAGQRKAIDVKMALLKTRLQTVGHQF